MKPQTLLRLYPRKWREKYGEEFVALVEVTGLHPGDVTDVARAAAREWLKVLAPTGFRLGALYLGCWASLLGFAYLFPNRTEVPSFLVASDHVRAVSIFLLSAIVSRLCDRAFELVRGEKSAVMPRVAGVVSALLMNVAAYLVHLRMPHVILPQPDVAVVIMLGTLAGRTAAAIEALSGPLWTPRPPSIRGLGLSA